MTGEDPLAQQRDAWLAAAVEIAKAAGQRAREYFVRAHELVVETKGTQDFVSVADRDVETLIRDALSWRFPDHAFFGEESGRGHGADGTPTWIVDPIDGTTNFLRGIPFWCVSIALAVEGRIQVGVVYDPSTGELFSAARGRGAAMNGVPLRPSTAIDPQRAVAAIGFSRKSPLQRFRDAEARLVDQGFEIRRLGSAALATAYVAAGRVDGYFELMLSPWDVVAGLLLCDEAGAKTSAFLDGPGLVTGNPWLCAAPGVYDLLSQASGIS